MPIHEKSLIRPENLVTHEHLELEGIDVSGHWSTFIESRTVTDYNESLAGGDRRPARRRIHPPLLAMRFVHQCLHDQRHQSRTSTRATGST